MLLDNFNIPELNVAFLKETLAVKDSQNYSLYFNAFGFGFQAYVDRSKAEPRVVVFSEFGRIPFSAENSEQRRRALVILHQTHLSLRHPTLRYGISKDSKVFLLARVPLAGDPSPQEVLKTIVQIILEALPVLCLLRQYAPLVLK